MNKKLNSESFFVFQTKAKPFSVQHYLNFEILGGFGKLVHDMDDDAFEISYVDLIKLWSGVNKNTSSKFDHLDLFFDDHIQTIANNSWDFIWSNYIDIEEKLASQNQNSNEDDAEIYLNVNNLENYHIFPTKQFIKKQSEFFESLKWRYHNPKQDLTVFENNNFVLSSSNFTNQQFNNIQAIYVNQVDTNNAQANFFDIEKFIFFDSENNFEATFQKTEIDNIVVFSIRTPLFVEDNFTPFFYYENETETSQKVAFFWFKKPLLHNETIPRFVFVSDKDFDDFLMVTTSLGIDKITNRRFLNSAAGVMAQQTKTIVIDGESISENVLKGSCFTTTYSFLIEYICQLLKPEFKIIKDADDTILELLDEYENPSVWGVGFLNNFSDGNKQNVDYPLNMTISDTATCIWDVESNFIFDNAVKFDGVLLMGTGIPEIDISPFQNNPLIFKSDFDIDGEIETKKDGEIETKKVLTANTTTEPSLFSVSVNFKRNSFFASDKTEYDQLETVSVQNLRFFIFDVETEDVLFISDKLDNVDKLYENTIFNFDCVFRFWSSWGETIELNDSINII